MKSTITIVQGGKTVYGAQIGILMLKTRFPRLRGDPGHADSWRFPVLYKIVNGATPQRVVRESAHGLLEPMIDAARELVDIGVDGIATNCGFLSLFQAELASACRVPVATSSLMQVPWVQAMLPPGKRVGVITISKATLTTRHLECAGAASDTPIEGTDEGNEFSRAILGDELQLDIELARQDILEAGLRLVERHPDVAAIVLECTNMVPFSAELSDAVSLPVFDFYSFVTWLQSGLNPSRF